MSARSLLACFTVGMLVGCGGPAQPQATVAEGPRDTLVAATLADANTMLPIVAETAFTDEVLTNMAVETVDTEFDCSLKKKPGYAKSWEWNDDGTVIRMQLRDDLKWEDGTPVTVEDIQFTYDLVADPVTTSPRYSFIERLKPDARPKKIDDTTIEWHFTEAYDRDTQMAHVNIKLVPKHVLEGADRASLRNHPLASKPLSYGPFRVAKWERNQQLVLEPNPVFPGTADDKAKISRVIFRVIPEYSTRIIELEAGKLDMVSGLLIEDADRLRETHPEINLIRRGWRSQDYIGWNLDFPLFQDVRVRKALALGADLDAMIERLLTSKTGEKYAKRAVSTVTPALCGVVPEVKPLPYDPSQAKALFAQAGWTDSDGDGVLDKNGKPFRFTLSTNTGNKRRADIAVLLQAQLKGIGVDVNIEKLESNTFFERLRKHDFEAGLAGWAAGLYVDPSELWKCSTKEEPHEFNFTGYCNPEVDALIDKGLQTPDLADSAAIWKEIQAKIFEDQPYLFLWWMDEIVAVHERFEGVQSDVISRIHHLEDWEVPPEKVKYRR
ncbi:MAG: ABC transporter substrate-binding protein [Myxococcota bacterium]